MGRRPASRAQVEKGEGTVEFAEIIELAGRTMEGAGVTIIIVGAAVATIAFLVQARQGGTMERPYGAYRRSLARAILLGLEFLIAGDIIRTVAIEPTFRSVGILAIIVAIRTFLSLELELEITGRWPWQQRGTEREAV